MVLLVEDEESYQQALQIGLSAEGFSVVGAMSLTEARGILKDKTPSLILLT